MVRKTSERNKMKKEVKTTPNWILDDLSKSGISPSDIRIIPLTNEEELKTYLGFASINGKRIFDIGGYFMPYPNVPGYCRFKLKEKIEDIKYLSPKGAGNHAYIIASVQKLVNTYSPDKPIFITEGEKKAAKATQDGFPTIALSGVWCFKNNENDFIEELEALKFKYRNCYIVFDSDITEKHNVRHAELRLAVELLNRGSIPLSVRLPNEDDGGKNGLDDFLVRYGKEEFNKLVIQADNTLDLQIREGTPHNVLIKEVARIKDRIEKERVSKLIATHFDISIIIIRAEIAKQTTDKAATTERVDKEIFTDQELEDAKALLKSENLLNRLDDLTERGGYVGEEINKTMLFLSFTSRLMKESISCIIKGPSASGKSALVETILNFIPQQDILKYSILTPKALAHFPEDISHKILFLQERQGGEAADYSIRTTISEGEISISYPAKDDKTGEFTTKSKKVEAKGLVYIETTTKDRIHAENQTRVFDLFMDESEQQTIRILETEAEDVEKKDLESELRVWRAAQTLLESVTISIPFASKLVGPFPKDKVRVRRDFKKFLSLIKSHALLHQYQREKDSKGRIIAIIQDLKAVLPIASSILSQSFKEYTPKQELVLKTIQNDLSTWEFSRGELKELHPDINAKTLGRFLKRFDEDGQIDWNGERGKKSKYSFVSVLSSMYSMDNFANNILKSLESIGDKDGCPQLSSMSSKNAIKDIRDNKGQNGVSLKDTNNEGDFGIKYPIKDVETKKYKELDLNSRQKEIEESSSNKHSDACDCEICIPEEET